MCTCDRQVHTSRVTCYGSTDPIPKWMKIFMIKERRRQDNSTPVLVVSREVGLAEEYGGLYVGVFAVSTGARSA